MVPLPRIHYGSRRYGFSFDAAIFVVRVDAGAIVLVIECVLVRVMYDETKHLIWSHQPFS